MTNIPRILLISNNAFSTTMNNGKTLRSFFEDYDKASLAQLYFHSEPQDTSFCSNTFRITDNDMLRSFFKLPANNRIDLKRRNASNMAGTNLWSHLSFLRASYFLRCMRELLWSRKRWLGSELTSWLDAFHPDIIFFCAGDSGFAYDIVDFVQKRFSAELVVFMTDDYIMPRRLANPWFWIRRSFLISLMNECLHNADIFYTISDDMQREYKKLFGVESKVIRHICPEVVLPEIGYNNDITTLVYAGGLHFGRVEVLASLGRAIAKYNSSIVPNAPKALLKIYSVGHISTQMLNRLNIEGASMFCGGLSKEELHNVLLTADILVHVESFEKGMRENTRLSISTKIPEYMAYGKAILAIGPSDIASMRFARGFAYCIVSKDAIDTKITPILADSRLRAGLGKRAHRRASASNALDIRNELICSMLELLPNREGE